MNLPVRKATRVGVSDAIAVAPHSAMVLAPAVRLRNFRRLMAGSIVSMLGSRISTIACPLLALYLTRSPVAAGLVAFAATVPSVLVYIPAGALVDQWDPRRTMLFSESGRGAAIAIIVIALATNRASIPLLIIIAFAEETLEVFSTLADKRCARALIPLDLATSAQAKLELATSSQAKLEARTHVVVLAGRPLGVFLFGLAPVLPFVADVLSFIASVGTAVSLKTVLVDAGSADQISGPRRRRLWGDIRDSLRWLMGDKYARAAMTLSASGTLIGQALIMVFLVDARTLHLSPVWIGVVLAASGIGGVLGSMSTSWLPKLPRMSLVLVQMLAWLCALTVLAIWGSRSFLCMAIVMASLSLTGARGNIEIDTYLVEQVDENMLARATSIRHLIAFSACAVGPTLGGILIQLYGVKEAVSGLVIITMVLTVVYAVASRSMCDRPRDIRVALSWVQRVWWTMPVRRWIWYVVTATAIALAAAMWTSSPEMSAANAQPLGAQSSSKGMPRSTPTSSASPAGSQYLTFRSDCEITWNVGQLCHHAISSASSRSSDEIVMTERLHG